MNVTNKNLKMLKNIYFAGCIALSGSLLWIGDTRASNKEQTTVIQNVSGKRLYPAQWLPEVCLEIINSYLPWAIRDHDRPSITYSLDPDMTFPLTYCSIKQGAPEKIIYFYRHVLLDDPCMPVHTNKSKTSTDVYTFNPVLKKFSEIISPSGPGYAKTIWEKGKEDQASRTDFARAILAEDIIRKHSSAIDATFRSDATFCPEQNILAVAYHDEKRSRTHFTIYPLTCNLNIWMKSLNASIGDEALNEQSARAKDERIRMTKQFQNHIQKTYRDDQYAIQRFYYALANRVRPEALAVAAFNNHSNNQLRISCSPELWNQNPWQNSR